ncbi:MAG: MFS transporter [Acidimicrobiales bacterium]
MKRSTIPLTAVLVAAMVVSTFQLFALAILAADIIDELGISRTQLGWLGAANTGVGAVLAPWLGRFTDWIGPRRSNGLVFLVSGIGLMLTGLATSYGLLVAASLICGIPQGWSNSATNKLIAERLGPAERGLVIGFKQSGVQLAIFLAGVGMPLLAAWFTWQSGLVGIGIACIVAGTIAFVVLGPDPEKPRSHRSALAEESAESTKLPPFVLQVSLYALLLGLAAGGVGRFLPLFANEKLGLSVAVAGWIVAFQGIVGMVARLMWGRAAEARLPLRGSLFAMALGGTLALGGLLIAESVGAWVLVPVAIVSAFTLSAWNVVANLAMIKSVPSALSGRATGIMMLAFLAGLTVSSPAVGWVVDQTGSYRVAWTGLLVLCSLGALSVSRDIGPRGSTEAVSPATAGSARE